jgi:hypothetical protein
MNYGHLRTMSSRSVDKIVDIRMAGNEPLPKAPGSYRVGCTVIHAWGLQDKALSFHIK